MAILKNKRYANAAIVTAFGKIQFDADGKADIDDTAAAKLATLEGFSIDGEVSEVEKKTVKETKSEQVEDAKEVEADDAEEEDEVDLASMNVPQLRKYAKDNGIDLGNAQKKDDIIAVIKR